jgi:hypothetical protein
MRWSVWIFILLLVACSAESAVSPTQNPPEPVAVATPVTVDMNTGIRSWNFRESRPSPPTSVLLEREDGFALDPNWQIAEIEYDYDWGGLGFYRDMPNEIIMRDGDTFIRNDQPLATKNIEAFIHSIARFHPSQRYVSGNGWTDDYPSHTIQITGVDGQTLVIMASSTGNPGDGPWNLIYNDHLYAQYDGAFGYGMAGIFDYSMRGTAEDRFGDMFGEFFSDTIAASPAVSFSTRGLPPQIEYGFDGLFPIADSFTYGVDTATGEIKGEIVGRRAYGEYEQKPIYDGTFAELNSLTLHPTTQNAVVCAIEPIVLANREEIEGDAAWRFRCPMGTVAEGTPYWYPIEAQLRDNDGNLVTLHGTLLGVGSHVRPPLQLPLPANLRTLLESNPSAAQLLAEHEYVSARYNTAIDPLPPHAIRSMDGEITFYGTVEINGILFPYQITTPFLITDNRLDTWDLTLAEIDSFVEGVATNPTTQLLIASHPNITFNLSYSKKIDLPRTVLNSYITQLTDVRTMACGDIRGITLPTSTAPLRTVGYYFGDGQSHLSGVFDAGEFYPYDAALHLDEEVPSVMLPPALGITEPLQVGYFRFNHNDFARWLRFGLDSESAPLEHILAYQTIAEVWGAEVLTHFEQPTWLVKELHTFHVTPSGDIQLVACE